MSLQIISEGPAHEVAARRVVIHSDRMGRDLQVTVTHPFATPFAPEQTFPAIVALDDGYDVAGPMARLLAMAEAMASAFVISVGYPADQTHHRNTDLLHEPWTTQDGRTFGGGGAAFQAFLLDDLMPFVMSMYPIDQGRIAVFGHSAGGLFAANILATRPDAFAGYIISSAPAGMDLARRMEAGLSKASGKRAYLAVGSHEDQYWLRSGETVYLLGFARLDATLRRTGVDCRSRIYPDENHLSLYVRVIPDAFAFILPPRRPPNAPVLKVPAKSAARCVGTYAFAGGRRLAVTLELGLLRAEAAELAKAPLMHIRGRRHYWRTSDVDIAFDHGGCTVSDGSSSWRGERVRAG